jgi:hypothetical protein
MMLIPYMSILLFCFLFALSMLPPFGLWAGQDFQLEASFGCVLSFSCSWIKGALVRNISSR